MGTSDGSTGNGHHQSRKNMTAMVDGKFLFYIKKTYNKIPIQIIQLKRWHEVRNQFKICENVAGKIFWNIKNGHHQKKHDSNEW